MLQDRLDAVLGRLDALREGRSDAAPLWARARAFFVRASQLTPMNDLKTLDRELDQVGIHTAPDAELLRKLGKERGRAAELRAGLAARAERALGEVEGALGEAEGALVTGAPIAGAASALVDAFPKLARIVRVAEIFASSEPAPFEIFPVHPDRSGGVGTRAPESARVAVAQFWAERARANASDLVQKRRDLDAARELLLRIGSEADRDQVRALRIEVAAARERARAVPAVRSLQELARHLRVEARRDPRQAYRSLRALYDRAVEAGDAAAAEAAVGALTPFVSSVQPPSTEDKLAELAFDLTAEQRETFELAAGCARFFDVEDALAEEILEAETQLARPVPRRVPYPTQQLTFDVAAGLHEANDFVLSDPRLLIYDLASGRQQVRAYLDDRPPPEPRKVRRTAVRVYVCDASGSMFGARARFRDAIVLAELDNLRLKAKRGLPVDPLYLSFFNDQPTELTRIDTAPAALRQMQALFESSPAEGQTDITLALMAAFDSIRAAQGKDPYLARATVVLVTDGEDRVDLDLIRRMRAPLDGGIDIAFSFISLGEENRDLKSVVEDQRRKGGRAFYLHLSDGEIRSARTEFDSTWRTILPADLPGAQVDLADLLPRLEALEAIAAGRPLAPPAESDLSFDGLFPARAPAARAEPDVLARTADILGAIAEAASLTSAERRGAEALALLRHLLSVYQMSVPTYLAALGAGDARVSAALERLRLLCRPFR